MDERKGEVKEKEQKEVVAAAKKAQEAMQQRQNKRRRSDSKRKNDKTIKTIKTTPESEMQIDLTGVWSGEVLDSDANVTQVTDCVLRFFNDAENGQSMIEGRCKTSSAQNGQSMAIVKGVWDFNSSRFILVLESTTKKTTYMGWMQKREKEDAKLIIKSMDSKQAARGIGHTLEGNAATGHIRLRKRENTRRASEESNVRQLIRQAKGNEAMKRGNAASSSASDKRNTRKKSSSKQQQQQQRQNKNDKKRRERGNKKVSSSSSSSSKRKRRRSNMSNETPMKRLSLRYGQLQTSIKFQLQGATKWIDQLAGPVSKNGNAPEHMTKMNREVENMVARANALGKHMRKLETKLSLFGYNGSDDPNEDRLWAISREDSSSSEEEEMQDDEPASPLPSRKRPTPLIANSVFEALQPDFLPVSAIGKRGSNSRSSSRGSLMSRGSSRESTRSRGTTPVASKRLAKFFQHAKAGAESTSPGKKSPLPSLKLKSTRRQMSEPSLRSLQVIVSTPRAGKKYLRKRVQLKGVRLDSLIEK